MIEALSEAQWARFDAEGYVKLGRQLDDATLRWLQDRADAVMLGESGVPERCLAMFLPDGSAAGWPAPRTIGYKEIYGMEHEPSFLRYMQRPLFRHVGGRVYGAGRPIAINRAMFFAKPSFVTGDDNPRVAASLNIGFHQARPPAHNTEPPRFTPP